MIHSITLTNFRCFDTLSLACKAPLIVIEGPNGCGKTSLLEALHYSCYLRSFRTASPREMIKLSQETCSIVLEGSEQQTADWWNIRIGCSAKKRSIKINDTAPTSYKELVTRNPLVSILEHDLSIISGSPEERRTLLDSMVLLLHPDMAMAYKQYRLVLDQRNALLAQHASDEVLLDILTEKMWLKAHLISEKRQSLLDRLAIVTQELYQRHFQGDQATQVIELKYAPKIELASSYQEFKARNNALFFQEKNFQRTLFGPHLDDMHIIFFQKSARLYASRGQQKLLLFVLKLAQSVLLDHQAVLLLDDVLSDFDAKTLQIILPLVQASAPQVFITAPLRTGVMGEFLRSVSDHQEIQLT